MQQNLIKSAMVLIVGLSVCNRICGWKLMGRPPMPYVLSRYFFLIICITCTRSAKSSAGAQTEHGGGDWDSWDGVSNTNEKQKVAE